MFKFNFNSENEDNVKEVVEDKRSESNEELKPSGEHEITSVQYAEIAENLKNAKLNVFISNDLEIGYLDTSSLPDQSDTDLIPRVYEGGFKIWECTQDLADIFTSPDNDRDEESHQFADKSVCDLGCSAGVLGIVALIHGAGIVDFQDYVSKFICTDLNFFGPFHYKFYYALIFTFLE